MRPHFVTLAILAGTALGGAAQDPVPQQLEKRISLEGRGSFKQLLEILRGVVDLDIVVDPRSGTAADLDEPRELSLKDVKASSALGWVTSLYGLSWAAQRGTVVIGKPELLSAPVLKVYDVQSLLVPPVDCPGPVVETADEQGGGAGTFGFSITFHEAARRNVGEEFLVALVKEMVAPGTWEGLVTADLAPDGRLLVTHTPRAQEEVSRLLEILGTLSSAMVTLTAEIVEADEGCGPLLRPGAPTTFGAGEIEKVAERVRAARKDRRARVAQVTAAAGQRVHTALHEEGSTVVDWEGNDPIISSGTVEVLVLDARPVLVSAGRSISVELRLSLGQSGDPVPVTLSGGRELAFRERTLSKLATTFVIPNGGGVLFALPSRGSSSGRSQLCLLRAASTPRPPAVPARAAEAADVSARAVAMERLRQLPAGPVSVEGTTADFARWLRGLGLNAVLDEEVRDRGVSAHFKRAVPADAFSLVLKMLDLGVVVRDEAVWITTRDRERKDNRVEVFDVRDLAYGPQDFPPAGGSEPKTQSTGEDLAHLVRNMVAKDQWEEAHGASIQYDHGALIVRNSPEVLRSVGEFLRKMRESGPQLVHVRADLLVAGAEEVEAILGPGAAEGYLIDADQYDRLARAAAFQERLGWHCSEGQETAMAWVRSTEYVRDFDLPEKAQLPDDPITDTLVRRSHVNLRPVRGKDGRSVTVDVTLEERRVFEVQNKEVGNGLVIQVPLTSSGSLKTTVRVPEDRMAVFRWSAPSRGQERRWQLLVLRPALAPAPR
jgi:hypothetical protein